MGGAVRAEVLRRHPPTTHISDWDSDSPPQLVCIGTQRCNCKKWKKKKSPAISVFALSDFECFIFCFSLDCILSALDRSASACDILYATHIPRRLTHDASELRRWQPLCHSASVASTSDSSSTRQLDTIVNDYSRPDPSICISATHADSVSRLLKRQGTVGHTYVEIFIIC